MRLIESWYTYIVCLFDLSTFNPSQNSQAPQQLLQPAPEVHQLSGGPVFNPPYPPNDPPPPGHAIKCDYSAMGPEWHECSTSSDRGCWLKGPGGKEFNITTDYELKGNTPKGILRKYVLDVSDIVLAPDGVPMLHGKVFNGSFPGPWIQACWGDTLEITVRNKLRYNGTTIHWHGIRQRHTVEMDGVNGVTQCPIAPGDEFTYTFDTLQYGSSWYHSHYSLQYPDGLVSPLTIYGPSSANYDEAIAPLLMTDWNHISAFEEWAQDLFATGAPNMTNILLNGKGQFNVPGKITPQPERYTTLFKKGVRYLIRLINTSTATDFVFAIDNHKLTVVGSDFVPIHPYTTDSILVAIGQRYHVIVEANPTAPSPNDAYWIRTIPANGCGNENFPIQPDNRTGIVRYDATSRADPTTKQGSYSIDCADEPFASLQPIVPWQVGEPANEVQNNTFEVALDLETAKPYNPPNRFLFSVAQQPLWLNFSEPTILNLNEPATGFPTNLDIITEDQSEGSWVYLVIKDLGTKSIPNPQLFVPLAHPIHLHGHDFVILAQENTTYPGSLSQVNLKKDNPPRRDVALLPSGGFLVIAFKTDNPGTWLLHCHIAWHASSGLALQVMENKREIRIDPKEVQKMDQLCENWDRWVSNPSNLWDPKNPQDFQDDSGV